MSNLSLLNIWSVGHFLQWMLIARFVFTNWYLFLALSLGWELLELALPYEFTEETWENKISDIAVNCMGFYLGLELRSLDNK